MADNSSSCPPGTVTNDALNEEMGPFGDAAVRAANGLKDDISASACKELRTIDQVDQDFIQLFRHLSLDAQQSLRNSPARILTVGPQTLGSRGGTGSPSSNGASEQGDDSGSEHSSNNELDIFPHNPMVFEQALGHAVPVEILDAIRQYLPPIDEILLSYTHPNIFNSDRFSFYQLDCEYQPGWQNGNPAYEKERMPLLFWAITTGAPLDIIRTILDKWRSNGMDVDLNWAINTPRTRKMAGFYRPIAVALRQGRLDVVQLLRDYGSHIRGMGTFAITIATDMDCVGRFDDATWRGVEDLILEMYRRNQLFKYVLPDTPYGIYICNQCVSVGWLRLFRLYVNDWTIANMDPNKPLIDPRNTTILRQHRHLANQMNTWLELAVRCNSDNTAMIDYLADILVNSQRNTRDWDPLPLIYWYGLQHVILYGTFPGGKTPMIHRNAVHIIKTFLSDFPNMIPCLAEGQTLRRCMESEDNLPLLQLIFPTVIGTNRRTPQAVGRMAVILRYAVASRTGVPRIVAWLMQQEGMMLARYTNEDHVLGHLGFCEDPAGVRANLATLIPAHMGPNEVFFGWHELQQQRDAVPLDLVHQSDVALVELVAQGGVGLAFASPQKQERARARLQLYEDRMDIRTMGRSLAEVMRCGSFTYEVRRRIVDFCIDQNIGPLPYMLRNV